MAELVGLVSGAAGLVSLSLQFGEIAIKLRQVYRSFKGASDAIEGIAFELETFSLLLRALERDRLLNGITNPSEFLVRCIKSCATKAALLESMVNKLEASVKRSKVRGKISILSEEVEIERLYNGIDRAKGTLILAYNLETESRRQHDKNELQKLLQLYGQTRPDTDRLPDQALNIVVSNLSDDGADNGERRSELVRRKRVDPRRRKWEFSVNSLFTSSIWALSLSRSQNQWTLNLHSSPIVPFHGEIMSACRSGDLAAVKRLFAEGKASPYDVDPHGGSALCRAAAFGHVELCRYILSQRQRLISDSECFVALCHYLVRLGYPSSPPGRKSEHRRVVDMFRLFIDHAESYPAGLIDGETMTTLWFCIPDADCMQLLLNALPIDYNSVSMTKRLDNARMPGIVGDFTPDVFLKAVGCKASEPLLATSASPNGTKALHIVAYSTTFAKVQRSFASWAHIVNELVKNGCGLHAFQVETYTPLMAVLASWVLYEYKPPSQSTLATWLRLLEAAGVDLKAYGEREASCWNPGLLPKFSICNSVLGMFKISARLHSFSSGSTVNDWTVYVQRETKLPIYERSMIPGSWLPSPGHISTTLVWKPDQEDYSQKFRWHKSEIRLLVSKPFPILPFGESRVEHFTELFTKAQDDTSVLFSMIAHMGKTNARRRRGYSEPTMPREADSCGIDIFFKRYPWRPRCHFCCLDSCWRFGAHVRGDGGRIAGAARPDERYPVNWRRCAKGLHVERDVHGRIFKELIDFYKRHHSRAELAHLPYEAYQPEDPFGYPDDEEDIEI